MAGTQRHRRDVGQRQSTSATRVTVACLVVLAVVLTGCSGTPLARRSSSGGSSAKPGASTSAAAAAPVVAPVPVSAMPPDARTAPTAACAQVSRPSGWTSAENARPGTALPDLPPAITSQAAEHPSDARPVLGYLDSSSAACGDVVRAYLSGSPQPVRLAAYRLGWYGGAQARLVWRSAPFAVPQQTWTEPTAATHLVEPNWARSVDVPVTADWPPGVYAVIPEQADAGPSPGAAGRAVGPLIPLVVRDDNGREPVLFMASTMTWNAYDDWGGWSLYGGPGSTATQRFANRARVVAMHRPLTGSGYDQLRYMDLPVVRWLESLGIDVAYTTDVDIDARPSQLVQHAELVVGGHSEYWTTRMYDAVEATIAAGVNVAFLGANNIWWHVRIEDAGEHEVVYRLADEDPLKDSDPMAVTVLWSQYPFHRDMNAITGETHAGINVRGGLELLRPPAWFTAGTTLHDGSTLPGSVGNEADGYNPIARRPDHLQVLAAGVMKGNHGPVLVTSNYVTAGSGAGVFSAGTTDWACELGPQCFTGRAPKATSAAVRQLTRNVIVAFSLPRAGQRNPVDPVLPPDAAHLLTGFPAAAVGTYGKASDDDGGGGAKKAGAAAVSDPS